MEMLAGVLPLAGVLAGVFAGFCVGAVLLLSEVFCGVLSGVFLPWSALRQ